VLVELNVVEQRYAAVVEVLNEGVSVTEAAARAGVTRQTVQRWLRRYAADGLAGLVDRSSVPASCPHQMDPVVEARIVALRQEHPGWGPRTLGAARDEERVDGGSVAVGSGDLALHPPGLRDREAGRLEVGHDVVGREEHLGVLGSAVVVGEVGRVVAEHDQGASGGRCSCGSGASRS
jgi:transposase-like protein